MASTGEQQRNDKSGEWAAPRQQRRFANAGRQWPGRRAVHPVTRRLPGQHGTVRAKPVLSAIMEAVEEMREELPRIDVGGLYQQFRCRGGNWALVTREDVRAALAGIESAARREFVAPETEEPSRRPVTRTPHSAWPQFRQAVGELYDGGADICEMVRRLRASGWRVSADDVAGALRRIKAANTPRHFLPGRSLPAPRQAGPGICPSCGRPVTDLGLCRCS
jgi:hypothetical protein